MKAEEMPKFSENPDYREYERLLRDVHRLIAHGQGDSADADALREQMEVPATTLTSEEMSRLDGLSADLYMLQGREVPARNWERWTTLAAELREAWEWNNWGAILTLLRQNAGRILPPAQIAYFRGRAYAELGHPEIAFEFMRYAVQLNQSFHYFELDLLRRVDNGEAIRVSKRDLESPFETPAVKSLAAGIAFQSTRQMPESESRPIYEAIVSALRKTLREPSNKEAILPVVRAHAFITLGLALDALGRSEEALEVFNRAVKESPDEDVTLVGRGIVNLHKSPSQALADFQRAIALGTQALLPYLAVGLEAMKAGRFQQASKIVDMIGQITTNPHAVALASEWAGIIAAETDQPADLVRACFRIATELDPSNTQIQRNSQVFEERLRRTSRAAEQHERWEFDEPLDLHEARAQISEMNRSPLAAIR